MAEATGDSDFLKLLRKVVVGDENKPIHENMPSVKAWLHGLITASGDKQMSNDVIGLQRQDEHTLNLGSQELRRNSGSDQRKAVQNAFAETRSINSIPIALIALIG